MANSYQYTTVESSGNTKLVKDTTNKFFAPIFGIDTNGDGYIGSPAGNPYISIESSGNTKLVKDTTNKFFAQVGQTIPTAINNGGQQIFQNIYAGWQTLAAETVNGQNQVLWKNTAGDYLHIWRLDNNWNWVSSEGQYASNSAAAFTQETNFGIDTNGDGIIGSPYTTVESSGNTKLVKDTANKFFAQVGTNTPTAINNGGQQIFQGKISSLWFRLCCSIQFWTKNFGSTGLSMLNWREQGTGRMSDINDFKDLIIWQKGMDIAQRCYFLTKLFPKDELYGMVQQIRRSAVSIPANISEGYGRRYRGEYIRFLNIAQGSVNELETHLILSHRVGLCSEKDVEMILNLLKKESRMIISLIKKLEN